MYRTFATVFAPASPTLAVDRVGVGRRGPGREHPASRLPEVRARRRKAASSSARSGSALIFLFFVSMNLWKPRFFCRFLCPLGALLGVIASKSLFRINRIVRQMHRLQPVPAALRGRVRSPAPGAPGECFACMNCIDDCPEDALEFTMLAPGQEAGRAPARPVPPPGRVRRGRSDCWQRRRCATTGGSTTRTSPPR